MKLCVIKKYVRKNAILTYKFEDNVIIVTDTKEKHPDNTIKELKSAKTNE